MFKAFGQNNIQKAQAMFIYNFTRLIEYPTEYKTGEFVIGVFGSKESYNELKTYAYGKTVGSQNIIVKYFNSIEEVLNCQILFISFSKTKEIINVLSKLNGSTLIISEKNGAINNGSAINFIIEDDKLKFQLKPYNAEKYKIKVSSKLTEMACEIII